VFSITKSVTSALVGIAIADGTLALDERLPWRREVTVRQLLSMTAGYAPALDFQRADPQTLASRALVNEPGTFSYDSGSYDLLADLLERATGLPIARYAQRRLFGPMGIRGIRWPAGRGASGLLLRPRRHSRLYGYGWWIQPHSYAAYGDLGQVLAVYPHRDEVVLVTSSREDAKPLQLVRRIAGE
jgi:CubicO group peptidase (beta-lactamase class C family)